MLRYTKRPASFLPKKISIVAAKRTPIGSFMGSLKDYSALELSVQAIKWSLDQSYLRPDQITQIILGQSLQSGSGQSLSRQCALYSNLLPTTICTNINKLCASGLKSIILACQTICISSIEIIIAGGAESMSQSPFILPNQRRPNLIGDESLADSLIIDYLTCPFNKITTGKSVEETALRYNITRSEQDDYSKESYLRTEKAWSRSFYRKEMQQFEVLSKSKDKKFVREDEGFRKLQVENLPTLKPLFLKNGTITAGNSASFSDAAAFLIVMNEDYAKLSGIPSIARILAFAETETDPLHFAESTKDAIKLALNRAGVKIENVDLFEINEDFSASVLANMKLLGLDHSKVNINGGAIALGHPAGVSGARIVATLIYSLREKNKRLGVAALAHAGGGAIAIVIEVV